jgi:two-component system, cell cycle sensor histidine kinase and response regulator CckA
VAADGNRADPPAVPAGDPTGAATAGIAHDFNNLLSVILTCAGELERELDDATQRERATEIREAGRRGAELTRRLLEVSCGRSTVPVPIELNAAVERMRGILNRTLGPRIDLACELDSRLPAVLAAPGQVEQVLVSLLDNCRDAIGSGPGAVIVRTGLLEADGRDERPAIGWFARLAVTDDGSGMSPAVAARAGERFFTTKGAAGNGLGLAGARDLARAAGGELRLSSVPGRGTTVEILLPAVRSNGDPLTRRRGRGGG